MFDTLGVDVRLRCFNSQMDCDTAFAGCTVEGIITDVVRAKHLMDKGTPIALISTTNAYWQLIANRKARLKEIKQFGDKMIAMTRNSATDYLCNSVLKDQKLSSVVFRIQVNDVHIRLNMLLNNEMDGAWLAEPFATTARLVGNHVVADSRDMRKDLGIIAVRQDKTNDTRRKKQLAAFEKAYNMACDSLNTYGMGHYKDVLRKYYHIDNRTIASLPKLTFNHISKPDSKYLNVESINN